MSIPSTRTHWKDNITSISQAIPFLTQRPNLKKKTWEIHILGCLLCITDGCDFLFHLAQWKKTSVFPCLQNHYPIWVSVKDVPLPWQRCPWTLPPHSKGWVSSSCSFTYRCLYMWSWKLSSHCICLISLRPQIPWNEELNWLKSGGKFDLDVISGIAWLYYHYDTMAVTFPPKCEKFSTLNSGQGPREKYTLSLSVCHWASLCKR